MIIRFLFSRWMILLVILSHSGSAWSYISASTNRLVFDQKTNSQYLVISNKTDRQVSFSTRIVHLDMTEDGNIQPVDYELVKHRSARELIRYSPKKGTIPPRGQQVVRFKVKKSAGITPGEYRSYFKISSEPKPEQSTANVSLSASIAYHLPLIVRVGHTHAQSRMVNASLEKLATGFALSFYQSLSGNRSIYGHYKVMDNKGQVLGELKNIAVYLPLKQRKVMIPLQSKPTDSVDVYYQEDPAYGGSIELMERFQL